MGKDEFRKPGKIADKEKLKEYLDSSIKECRIPDYYNKEKITLLLNSYSTIELLEAFV